MCNFGVQSCTPRLQKWRKISTYALYDDDILSETIIIYNLITDEVEIL